MPQKPLKKSGQQKKQAANKHGKELKTRKGKFAKPPKKGVAAKQYAEAQELTKAINADNESHFAGVAEGSGGKLGVIKAPPVLATADQKQRHPKKK